MDELRRESLVTQIHICIDIDLLVYPQRSTQHTTTATLLLLSLCVCVPSVLIYIRLLTFNIYIYMNDIQIYTRKAPRGTAKATYNMELV